MKNYKRSIKNLGKGLKGVGLYIAGTAMLATPFTSPLGIATLTKSVKEMYVSVQGNYIENSMMEIQRNAKVNKWLNRPSNYIVEGLPTVKQFLEAYLTKNKMDFLTMQEVNLFLQLDSKDEKGNDILYNTNTHAGNYKMLQELEKVGMIEDLQKTYSGKKSLKFERLLLGNSNAKQVSDYRRKRIGQIKENLSNQKGVINKIRTLKEELDIGIDKKTKMYNVSFKKTDKTFNEQEICSMLGFVQDDRGQIDTNRFDTLKDKEGNIESIVYKKEYVFDMLKKRSRELSKNIKERAIENKDNIRDSLKQMTVGVNEVTNIKPVEQNLKIKVEEKNINNVR